MNPFIGEDTWILINTIIAKVTALPVYENGIVGDSPDFIFVGLYCHVDNTQSPQYDCTVTLKFQSTFDDSLEFHVLTPDHKITIFGDI